MPEGAGAASAGALSSPCGPAAPTAIGLTAAAPLLGVEGEVAGLTGAVHGGSAAARPLPQGAVGCVPEGAGAASAGALSSPCAASGEGGGVGALGLLGLAELEAEPEEPSGDLLVDLLGTPSVEALPEALGRRGALPRTPSQEAAAGLSAWLFDDAWTAPEARVARRASLRSAEPPAGGELPSSDELLVEARAAAARMGGVELKTLLPLEELELLDKLGFDAVDCETFRVALSPVALALDGSATREQLAFLFEGALAEIEAAVIAAGADEVTPIITAPAVLAASEVRRRSSPPPSSPPLPRPPLTCTRRLFTNAPSPCGQGNVVTTEVGGLAMGWGPKSACANVIGTADYEHVTGGELDYLLCPNETLLGGVPHLPQLNPSNVCPALTPPRLARRPARAPPPRVPHCSLHPVCRANLPLRGCAARPVEGCATGYAGCERGHTRGGARSARPAGAR